MGGATWWHFVPYEPDPARALARLRQREWAALREREAPNAMQQPPADVERLSPGVTGDLVAALAIVGAELVAGEGPNWRAAVERRAATSPFAVMELVFAAIPALEMRGERKLSRAMKRHAAALELRMASAPDDDALEALPELDPQAQDDIARFVASRGVSETASVLDVRGVGARRERNVAHPPSAAWLRRAFRTEQPALASAKRKAEDLADSLERGEVIFFPVYRGKRPVAWCFMGSTGD